MICILTCTQVAFCSSTCTYIFTYSMCVSVWSNTQYLLNILSVKLSHNTFYYVTFYYGLTEQTSPVQQPQRHHTGNGRSHSHQTHYTACPVFLYKNAWLQVFNPKRLYTQPTVCTALPTLASALHAANKSTQTLGGWPCIPDSCICVLWFLLATGYF